MRASTSSSRTTTSGCGCAWRRCRRVGSTAYEVAQDLPWTRRAKRMDELDFFNGALASMETMAHLELLAAQGKVSKRDDDGVNIYGPVS